MHRFEAVISPIDGANERNTIRIKSIIEERTKARNLFDRAVQENKTAILGELDRNSEDLFIISLGAIPEKFNVQECD